jgi:transposase
VARRYGVNSNLLFTGRRRDRASDVDEPVNIVPVRVATGAAPAAPAATPGSLGRMEIVLNSGERIVVGADVDASSLARVVKALSRR